MGLSLKVIRQNCLKNVDIRRTTTKHKQTHAAFVKVYNKESAKQFFKAMDAQEFQDPE